MRITSAEILIDTKDYHYVVGKEGVESITMLPNGMLCIALQGGEDICYSNSVPYEIYTERTDYQ